MLRNSVWKRKRNKRVQDSETGSDQLFIAGWLFHVFVWELAAMEQVIANRPEVEQHAFDSGGFSVQTSPAKRAVPFYLLHWRMQFEVFPGKEYCREILIAMMSEFSPEAIPIRLYARLACIRIAATPNRTQMSKAIHRIANPGW
jgi:hypothetical protein